MQCYNCDGTTDLKEWCFPEKMISCKKCSEYFRKCSTRACSMDVDLNVTGYAIISDDKILCDKVVCYYCVKDGNLPKELENQKIKKNVKLENKLKKTYRKKK